MANKLRSLLSKMKDSFVRKHKCSYAQAGEDLILDMIFSGSTKGFYLDIGANNPFEQSNTNLFYKKGWNGLNIDALPGSMKLFNRFRSRDINLEIPISNSGEPLNYYMFSPSFYNSFSKEQSEKYKHLLIGEKTIKTEKLSDVLNKYSGQNAIDFMSVDVEGMDLEVLMSNDWSKFRPKVIITEFFKTPDDFISQSELGTYLSSNGYTFHCNTPTNAFFLENNFLNERFKFN